MQGRQASGPGRSVVACKRAISVCLPAPATHRKHLGILVQSLQQCLPSLSKVCAQDANDMSGTTVRRCRRFGLTGQNCLIPALVHMRKPVRSLSPGKAFKAGCDLRCRTIEHVL